jgi:hypothetical protein
MRREYLHGLILGSAVVLSACGGGGGDAQTPPAAVPLTAANYQAVTTEVVDSVAGVGSLSDAVDLVTAASAEPVGISPALTSGEPASLVRYALSLTPRLQVSQRAQAQAVETYVESCNSGSLTIVANDADNNGRESSGDSVTITANNCVPQYGAPAINGSITLALGNVSYDRYGDLTSGTATISFNAFSSADVSLNGSARLSINSNAIAVDFNRLMASDGVRTRVYDFTLTVYSSGAAAIDGPIEVGGSTYVLSTPVRVTFAGAYPSAGTVRLSDGHGSRVDVVLSTSGYAATLYLKGDEVADGTFSEIW